MSCRKYSVRNTLKSFSGMRGKCVGIRFLLISFFLLLSGVLNAQISFGFNSVYKYLKGSEAATLASNWMTDGFNDSGWSSGNAPFRYGDGTGGTLLSDMQNNYSTVYLRTSFNAFSVDLIKSISLTVNYDDGFVIWVNGVMVLSRNAPGTLAYNSFATVNSESGTPVTFEIDTANVPLVEGENLLCIQMLNVSLTSSDIYFDMGISAKQSLPEVPQTMTFTFSHEAGFYDTPFNLTLKTNEWLCDILYTLDGSNPQTSPTVINGGKEVIINVDPDNTDHRAATPAFIVRASLSLSGFTPSKPITKTYIFLDKVLTQAYPGGNWPSSSVNGQVIDLGMDPDIVNSSRYSASMKTSLLEIPSVSLVTDNANMFGASTGIYTNAYGHGDEWERECSVELINPDNTLGFQINAGVRIRGGASRTEGNPKHAFRLFFRKEYGPGKLIYPLFEDEGATEFDKIDLRTEQNYSWSKDGDTHNTFIRDIFSRDLQGEMGQPYARGRYYHLYLNGMYWGLYQTEERPQADYAETYFGDNDDDYDVIKVSVEGWPYFNEATDGTMASWQDLWNRCAKGFTSNADYFALEGKDVNGNPVKNTRVYVDIDNLIDYMLIIFYTGNFDAPVSAWNSNSMANNYYAIFNRKNKGQGFVFIAHDSEHSMFVDPIYVSQGLSENRVTINDPVMTATGISNFQPQWLHQKLTANAEYRLRFADRAYKQFAAGGMLTPEKCVERLRKRKEQIDMAIIAESARWGDAKVSYPRNKLDDWLPELNGLENGYFPYRSNIVISQLKAAGLYTGLDPAIFRASGNVLESKVTFSTPLNVILDNPNTKGQIYYTTDGTDPRKLGGALSQTALVAADNSSLTISETTMIKSRVYDGQNWSAIKEIVFSAGTENYENLKVTEIQYHPADLIKGNDTIDGKDLEFLELKNAGTSAMNISGLTIDSAVFYVVPEGIVLPPKGFYVIASKPEEFYSYYGMNPSGNFSGNLSNSGEMVLIKDKNSNTILSFRYSDDQPWPLNADGEGNSLSANASVPKGDPGDYSYWKGSSKTGGSPFADDELATDVTVPADDIKAGDMLIYPNPASDVIRIKIDDQTAETLRLTLTDLEGNTVLLREVENNTELSLADDGLKAGIYIVSVEYNGIIRHAKLIYTGGK